ncbi:hypothetical protein D3C85_1353470 [compost metagenome]
MQAHGAGVLHRHMAEAADAFVAGDEGQARLHRPVVFGGVQVGMTNAGCLDLHQDLPGAGQGKLHFLDPQRFAQGVDHRCFHGLVHGTHLLG